MDNRDGYVLLKSIISNTKCQQVADVNVKLWLQIDKWLLPVASIQIYFVGERWRLKAPSEARRRGEGALPSVEIRPVKVLKFNCSKSVHFGALWCNLSIFLRGEGGRKDTLAPVWGIAPSTPGSVPPMVTLC